MKAKSMVLSVTLAAASVFTLQLAADHDIDLPINGDFRGAPSGYSPAPGWTLTADGGSARILPTTDHDDFMLELQASPARGQSVISGMHAVPGNTLKLEAKIHGTGSATVGYQAFDAAGTVMVAGDRQTVVLSAVDQHLKRYFTLPQQAKFVRIYLTAEAGSVAAFRDVDADVSIMPTAVQPAIAAPGAVAAPAAQPGAIAAPAAPAAPAAAQPASFAAPAAPAAAQPASFAAPAAPAAAQPASFAAPAVPAAAASAPAAAPAAVPPAGMKVLQHERYYMYSMLAQDEHFEITLPLGSDIDFELGEDTGKNLYWRVTEYNPAVCRVKIEHDQDGVFPIRWDKAEIELKAIGPGTTNVVMVCGGKKVTVHFTAQ